MTSQVDTSSLLPAYARIDSIPEKCRIKQYILRDNSPRTITTATQVIQKLLSNYSQLCATFPTQPQDNLEKEITEKKFLVINGDVICLSDEKKAPASAPQDFVDRFFSLSLLKQPVACIKNHYLELTYLPFWVERRGNVCPGGGDHKIVSTETDTPLNAQYPFEIDEELQCRINEFREEKLQCGDAVLRRMIEHYRNTVEQFKHFAKLRDPSMELLPEPPISESKPYVLDTPRDLFAKIQEFFPTAKMQVLHDSSLVPPFQLKVDIAPEVEPVTFTRIVLADALHEELTYIFWYTLATRVSSTTHLSFKERKERMDTTQCSCFAPLTDWPSLQREIYEKEKGLSCVHAIINYLQHPQDDHDLSLVSLAPHQIDENQTQKELDYFRKAVEQMQQLASPIKQNMRTRFQTHFPNIYAKIFRELLHKNLHPEENTDDYQITLQQLKKRVIGQEFAVEQLAAILASQKNANRNQAFLFVGPTGLGKSELAKAVAEAKGGRLITLFMNQYQDATSVTKFFGAGLGYVGSTDKPELAHELDKCQPFLTSESKNERSYTVKDCVLLFDEFEKAHPAMKQSLLTLFDEWVYKMSFSQGFTNMSIYYELQNCVIIATSNLYHQDILQAFQKGSSPQQISERFTTLHKTTPLPISYSPELLGRMTIIPFGPIPKGAAYQSIIQKKLDLFLATLTTTFSFKETLLENATSILSYLENKFYGDGTDIRKISKYFETDVSKELHKHKSHWGDVRNVRITFSFSSNTIILKPATYITAFDCYVDLDPVVLI